MAHYWTPDFPLSTQKAVLSDWIEDLREFPAALVAAAVSEWRRTQTHRPTPADIRKLCCKAQAELRERSNRPALPAPDVAARQRATERDIADSRSRHYAEAEAARDRWARAHGCADFAEAWAIGLQQVGRRPARGAA